MTTSTSRTSKAQETLQNYPLPQCISQCKTQQLPTNIYTLFIAATEECPDV